LTIFGYARISTEEQNLERQLEALEKEGCHRIYSDTFSGAALNRPQLNELLEEVKEGDTIIIVDLTRFSRSTMDLFNLVDQLKEKGVFLKSIKDTWLDITSSNPYSSFLLTIMSAVSQLERDLTRQRMREGIAVAKKNGVYKGRAKTFTENNPRMKHALDLYESNPKEHTVKKVCQMTGISEATFYRNWRKRKVNFSGGEIK
jgi:DNA invertase Pin-like site-specific DNA recombinase